MRKPIQIKFTPTAWAKALAIDRKTLASRLAKAGLPNCGQISARDVFAAMAGDKDASIIRLNNAKADALEQKRKVRDGELVDVPTVERLLWQELLGPLKQEMDLMPDRLEPLILCNETDRSANKAILLEWVEGTKKRLLKNNERTAAV